MIYTLIITLDNNDTKIYHKEYTDKTIRPYALAVWDEIQKQKLKAKYLTYYPQQPQSETV